MNEFLIGERRRYAGLIVTVRSLRAGDGKYTVEDESGAFFRAAHYKLMPLEIKHERTDQAASFQNIASRAAMSAKGRVKSKSKQK